MAFYRPMLIVLALVAADGAPWPAMAQGTVPSAATLAERAARRFPQPVRVGDLLERQVLRPVAAQTVLGRVASLVRDKDGAIVVMMRTGGLLGFGTRLIAVPVDAVALLGEYVTVLDFTPEQLQAFPTASEAGATPIPRDETIRVGLAKPFH